MLQTLLGSIDRLRRRWLYGLVSALVALSLILSTAQPSPAIPWLDLILRGVQVIQLSNLGDRQEVELGRRINDQLTSQEFRLVRDSNIRDYVDQIGQRLAPSSSRPNIPYVFQAVESEQVNAFATMGGYVYVTTGLMRLADNEAELASVIGHEIGHIAARHAVEQMREAAIASGLVTAAGLDRNTAVNLGVELAIRRPHSRQAELEADQLGLANITSAGYAPGAMVDFMQKLVGQGSVPTFLSTHPATSDRIAALQRQINPATADQGIGQDDAAYRSRIQALR
ncbi:M48 family metalloprotease [Microcoleus sp. FACHB-1515]|uniref:M48 family metallopeptidase n=2 Tax=Cyanophyceae TaxID=3028117 RepID=UPI0016896238|nr:M48 family metallopeptidase [Microcoleus sp. FACHB-1515]MBD2090885.1 M48 family metalloprotease [Microcoleus sp. FACHB-1515]